VRIYRSSSADESLLAEGGVIMMLELNEYGENASCPTRKRGCRRTSECTGLHARYIEMFISPNVRLAVDE
jgi:hypothetical protein